MVQPEPPDHFHAPRNGAKPSEDPRAASRERVRLNEPREVRDGILRTPFRHSVKAAKGNADRVCSIKR